MAYSYQISFNASDYVPIYPHAIEMNGGWVSNTFIWRESIKELKLNKDLNSSVYETIKSYFSDPTKFETQIFVKILKNNVQESLHWFGIKWGEIDHDLTYYKVSPKPYDLYAQYLENNMERKNNTSVFDIAKRYVSIYDFSDTNYAYLAKIGNASVIETAEHAELFEDAIKNTINRSSGLATSEIVSSILWGDADEEGDPETTTNGMLIDYVTGDYSKLRYALISYDTKAWREMTIKDVFEMLRVFQIYPYFDSNDKLRFEHISRIISRLESGAISITLNTYDAGFEYDSTSIPVQEEIKMYSDSTSNEDYDDFYGVPIEYSYIRNRIDAQNIDLTFEYYTNLVNFIVDRTVFANVKLLISGYKNFVMTWRNDGSIGTYSNTDHTFDILFSSGQYCQSYDFHCDGYTSYTLTVVATTLTEDIVFGIRDRSSGALLSNEITISSTGTTSDTLVIAAPPSDTDCVLRLASAAGVGSGEFVGYVFLEELSGDWYYNPQGEGILADPVANSDFSIAEIQDKYWKDYRISRTGTMNGGAETFNTTQYNLMRTTINQYFASPPSPLNGIFDQNMIGKINSWTRNIETGFIEMEIGYQENNGLTYLMDEYGNLLLDGNGDPLYE